MKSQLDLPHVLCCCDDQPSSRAAVQSIKRVARDVLGPVEMLQNLIDKFHTPDAALQDRREQPL